MFAAMGALATTALRLVRWAPNKEARARAVVDVPGADALSQRDVDDGSPPPARSRAQHPASRGRGAPTVKRRRADDDSADAEPVSPPRDDEEDVPQRRRSLRDPFDRKRA